MVSNANRIYVEIGGWSEGKGKSSEETIRKSIVSIIHNDNNNNIFI